MAVHEVDCIGWDMAVWSAWVPDTVAGVEFDNSDFALLCARTRGRHDDVSDRTAYRSSLRIAWQKYLGRI